MKKLTSFLFALTMIFTSTACGDKKKNKEKETSKSVSVTQTTYGAEEIFLNDLNDISYIQYISPYDGGICLFYISIDGKCKFARTDNEFNVELSAVIFDKNLGVSYNVHDDGSFDAVIADTDFEFEFADDQTITNYDKYLAEAEFTFRLLSFDGEGNLTGQCDIEDAGKYFDAEISGMQELVPCGDDKFMLSFGSGLVLFDRDGNIIDIDAGNQYSQCYIAPAGDGRVLYTQNASYGYMKPDSVAVPSDMKYSELLAGNFRAPIEGSGDFLAYFNLNDGLYGLTESEELILVVDYDKSLMTSTSGFIVPFGDGKFIMNGGQNMLKVYTRRPDGYVENRKAIDLWMIECGSTGMHDMATDFCAVNDQYYINVTENVSFDDVPAAVLSGDGPDIIHNANSGEIFKLVNLGALADLTPYLDGGTGLSRDEILPNVLEAYEYKGGIYTLSTSFCVQLLTAKKDFIGDEYRNWSIKDFLDIYDSRPDEMMVFDQRYITSMLCSEDVWIDREKGTCNYDSDEFIRILEICKEHEKNYPEIDYNNSDDIRMMMSLFSDNKTMLGAQTTSLSGLEHLFRYLGSCGLTIEDVSLLNLPGKEKGMISPLNNYSIMTGSDCPDGAWEFISYAINYENQWSGDYMHPVIKEAFEKSIEKFIDPDGGRVIEHSSINDVEHSYEASASEEQIRRYYDFVMNCSTISYNDDDVQTIFHEEYDRFLNDEITAEECANNLQNRISILLAENS